MRVLVATYAEKSHFLAVVPVAWALQTAGHEVRVATQPALVDAVADAGLTVTRVGADHNLYHVLNRIVQLDPASASGPSSEPFSLSEPDPGGLAWEEMVQGYRSHIRYWWGLINEPMLADLVRLCRQWRPDLVIWEAVSFAGAVAAEACGAAHARFLFASDLFARMRGHFLAALARRPVGQREDPLAEWLGSRAGAFGVEFCEAMTCGQVTISYLPEALQLPDAAYAGARPEYVPVRFVPYNGRSVVPGWLRAPPERPRVCLTLGTSAIDCFGAFEVSVQDLLEALGGLDVEVVATLPASEQARLGPVPSNTRLVEFVPLHALAPTCAAFVNHGGAATMCTALVNGIPQLVLPHTMFDEAVLSAGLDASGAGQTLPLDEVTPEAVRDGVVRLLEDREIAAAAARARDQALAMPSPNEIVGRLERLARQGSEGQRTVPGQ